jgi:hypothetical protein
MALIGRRIVRTTGMMQIAAMKADGTTRWRASQLRALLGVSAQTLARWRTWWAEAFTESAFWKAAQGGLATPIIEPVPHALLERFAGDEVERLTSAM